MKKISGFEFLLTMTNFMIGGTIIFPIGIDAKQDAWLAILVGMTYGIFLCLLFVKINSLYPGATFIGITQEIFGKYLGWFVGFIYATWCIYISIRNIRDFAEQITHNFLSDINIVVILTLMVILMIYALYQGIEVLIRVTCVIFPVVFVYILISDSYLMMVSGDFNNLKPILHEGLVLSTVHSKLMGFPYAELTVSMMIIPHVNVTFNKIKKLLILANIWGSLIILFDTVMLISVLGIYLAENLSFPIIQATQLTQSDLLKLNIIIVLVTNLVLIVKASVLAYAGIKGYSQLFQVSYKKMVFFVLIISIYLANIVAKSYWQHVQFGLGISLISNVVIGIYIPLITLIFYYLKRYMKKLINYC